MGLFGAKKATDPVCGMKVDPAKAAATVIYDETTYYFCSASCEQKFHANPHQFAAAASTR